MKNFGRSVLGDFEYEVDDGGLPRPLCYTYYELDENLQLVHRKRLWRDEFGKEPPHDIGPDTLYVAYSAQAEMTSFKVLGWDFPAHIFDQHVAYLAATNVLQPMEEDDVIRKKEGKGLAAACRAYGITGWEHVDKDVMRKDIGEGRWQLYGKEKVLDYNEEDVRVSTKLLRAQLRHYGGLPAADTSRVIFWSEYAAKSVALIQAHGMSIDMSMWNLVQEHKQEIVTALLKRFDPSHNTDCPIFDQYGGFDYGRFENWLASIGIKYWPRTITGKLKTDGDAFRLMSHIPGIAPPGKIVAYLDWRNQEIAVAAAGSQDQALIESYLGGDVYYTLAVNAGLTNDTDRIRWKHDHPEQRNRMKALQLAINYGMTVPSLARGLDRHPVVASKLMEDYKRRYPRLFEWRRAEVHRAMCDRRIESPLGWPLYISHTPNERTLFNFPMQSGGADMLRLAAVRLCEAGIVPTMLVHDAVLLEVDSMEQIEHAKEIMRWAGREICAGLDVGADVDQLVTLDPRLVGGAKSSVRFSDKRDVAQAMWATIMETLEEIGVWRRKAAS